VNASTITAICGVVIGIASFGVSAYVAWATRRHNRLSVRPSLGLAITFPAGDTVGLGLTNSGLGPARIISGQLAVDGERFGRAKPDLLIRRNLSRCTGTSVGLLRSERNYTWAGVPQSMSWVHTNDWRMLRAGAHRG
jgi:hypothetical protein